MNFLTGVIIGVLLSALLAAIAIARRLARRNEDLSAANAALRSIVRLKDSEITRLTDTPEYPLEEL